MRLRRPSAVGPSRGLTPLLLCLLVIANSSRGVAGGGGTSLAGKQPPGALAAAPDTATVIPVPLPPRANLSAPAVAGPRPPPAGPGPLSGGPAGTEVAGPAIQPSAPQGSGGWEASFAWGLYYSKLAVETVESVTVRWALDRAGSSAAVPLTMLRAEEWLVAGVTGATPEKKQREKKAEQALRMYYHAKWLAERNYARAAEWRYREASRLAREAKRSVLAAHALSRLGYFLMYWCRLDDAREVLRESERLNIKANPLAPFLYGVLERRTAGSDVARLHAAEERILAAAEQPSEELEVQRRSLVQEIRFWRAARDSPMHCLQGGDVAQVVVCFWGHLFSGLFGGAVVG